MTVEEAVIKLKESVQEFINLGDAEEALLEDEDNFMRIWFQISNYFKYILNNVEPQSLEWLIAIETINSIATENPSLEEWVYMMFSQDESSKLLITETNDLELKKVKKLV